MCFGDGRLFLDQTQAGSVGLAADDGRFSHLLHCSAFCGCAMLMHYADAFLPVPGLFPSCAD